MTEPVHSTGAERQPERPDERDPEGAAEAVSSGADEQVSAAPDEPIELDLPARESTGDDVVDAALDRVEAAQGAGLGDHLEAAAATQDALQQRLADTGE